MYSTKKGKPTKLSLIIPVYNEEKRIHNLFLIDSFIKNKRYIKELIVVNDGSKDKTLHMLRKYKEEIRFNLISYTKNKGKGYAIKKGVEKAKGSHVIFMDIDLSTPPETLLLLMKNIGKVDIIVGTRKNQESILLKRQSFIRENMGKFFTWLSQCILSVSVSDFTCGFKCFSKKAAKKLFAKQRIKRWAFDSEALFLARKYGFSLWELPVQWKDQKGTKVRIPQDVINSFIDLVSIRINDILGKY